VASARRIATFLELLRELEGGVRLEALALTSKACRYIHDVSLNAAKFGRRNLFFGGFLRCVYVPLIPGQTMRHCTKCCARQPGSCNST
jgi:hypothetical protein